MKAIVCGKEVELPKPGDLVGIFNYVKNHLLTQGERSLRYDEITNSDSCLYRTEDNTKACAAGCLIPDDQYKPTLEKQNSYCVEALNYYDRVDMKVDINVRNLIRRLQIIHDEVRVENWSDALDNLYKEFFENSSISP